jgi:cytochrome c
MLCTPSLPMNLTLPSVWLPSLALALSAMAVCHPAAAQSILRGQTLFEIHCTTCHALDAHRAGPALRGVVGRTAGKAPEYFYSEALESATHVWDTTKLKAWLTRPQDVVPGQEMNFQLASARDREDVVAYLASLSPRKKSPPPPKETSR